MSAPRTKIFVGHLPDGCRSEDLIALFSKFGTVTECDVINKYGFVHMRTAEQAEAAIRGLNNYNLRGSAISVEPSKSRLHPEPGAPGRARGGASGGNMTTNFGSRRGAGGPSRNGYSPQLSRGTTDSFRSFDQLTTDPYFSDRTFGQTRMRPSFSQASYEQPSIMFTSPTSDFRQRAFPAPVGTRDQYSVPAASLPPRSDPYERFMASSSSSSSSFLYSQRSPPRTMTFDPLGSQNRIPNQPPADVARRSFY